MTEIFYLLLIFSCYTFSTKMKRAINMEEKKSKKRFFMLLGIEVLIVVLITLFFLLDFDNLFSSDDIAFVDPNPPCDLREKTCKVELSKTQSVSLSVSPKGIPLMKPLSFVVDAKGVKSDTLEIKIYAINMEMGTHKLTLKRVSGDRFEGKQVLPTCIVGGMIWNADITSSSFADKKGVRFTFKTI